MPNNTTFLLDISKWQKQIQYQTTGSRDKFIAIHPGNKDKYYFKYSKDIYPAEFWSEVIAYRVGHMLGFNMCRYDVAFDGVAIGCISKSMVNFNEELREGDKFINNVNPEFLKENNFRFQHTFAWIVKALENECISHMKENVINMLIFDAIIDNTDRHSQNWAIVVDNTLKIQNISRLVNTRLIEVEKSKEFVDKSEFDYDNKFLIRVLARWSYYIKLAYKEKKLRRIRQKISKIKFKFSPIYDSGSSLGRELKDEIISRKLNNEIEFNAYLNRGKTDVRWMPEKRLKHYELMTLLKSNEPIIFKKIIKRIRSNYNKEQINSIIYSIDNCIPDHLAEYRLTDIRKKWLCVYINKRIEKLINI